MRVAIGNGVFDKLSELNKLNNYTLDVWFLIITIMLDGFQFTSDARWVQNISMKTYTLEFVKGNFAVWKTKRKFSKINLDHNHEQQNSKIKGVGGTIGWTENDSGLRRWLISGPEIARLLEEFELSHGVQLQDGI